MQNFDSLIQSSTPINSNDYYNISVGKALLQEQILRNELGNEKYQELKKLRSEIIKYEKYFDTTKNGIGCYAPVDWEILTGFIYFLKQIGINDIENYRYQNQLREFQHGIGKLYLICLLKVMKIGRRNYFNVRESRITK